MKKKVIPLDCTFQEKMPRRTNDLRESCASVWKQNKRKVQKGGEGASRSRTGLTAAAAMVRVQSIGASSATTSPAASGQQTAAGS